MDANYVREALLKYNYFPRHRTKSAEMPPFFDTTALTVANAASIANVKPYTTGYKGCDFNPYTLTRFNGGPRICGIPHPYPYCRLVEAIHTHWNDIFPLIQSPSSQIRPRIHKDGRLFVMDYESQFEKSKTYLKKQSCATYIARADISSFYPSLYTHALPWAVVGIETAKSNTNGSIWYNKLDARIRDCKRQETNGVLIGPGTSSIAAEIILSNIDRYLEGRGFSFVRFIDDYTCFCTSREEAARFLEILERQLAKFNLYLNFSKTSIEPLVGSELPPWIPDLQCQSLGESPTFFELKMFFSRAVSLSINYPQGSVLRYAVHALQGKNFQKRSGEYVLRTLLSFSLQYPHLTATLPDYLAFGITNGVFQYIPELEALVLNNARRRRSDAICWSIHLYRSLQIDVPATCVDAILKTYDPCAIALLYSATSNQQRQIILNFVKGSVLPRDPSAHQRNWFLLHYLRNKQVLTQNEVPDATLNYMAQNQINLFIE